MANIDNMKKEQMEEMIKVLMQTDPDLMRKIIKEELEKEAEAADVLKESFKKFNNDSNETYQDKNLSVTDNGALVYKTTGKPFVDLNFSLSSFRSANGQKLQDLIDKFAKCYHENPVLAWKYLFYVGDIREGAGERKAFLEMFKFMIKEESQYIVAGMLKLIPEYTRFDVWFKIWEAVKEIAVSGPEYNYLLSFHDIIGYLVDKQWQEDVRGMINGEEISLLAKWMPSINTSSKRTKSLAFDAMEMLGFNPASAVHQKHYRQTLSQLRAYINVVEKNMSENDWQDINYEKIPSKAAIKYKAAFYRHDNSRYQNYIDKAVAGEKKFNASVTQPHEIIRQIRSGQYNNATSQTLEAAWKNLKNMMVEDTIVVCDTSGSMGNYIGSTKVRAIDVSIGLAIYCAERLSGSMHNKFITFDYNPNFVSFSDGTLIEKMQSFRCINAGNTDIQAVFKLLADSYARGRIREIDMPSKILIISDMQFDTARRKQFGMVRSKFVEHQHTDQQTLFDTIKEEWAQITKGKVSMPKLIFWNVCDTDKDTIPMVENENGLILLSGFSTNILKMAMSGQYDPFAALLEILGSKRYLPVESEFNNPSWM